MNTPQVTEFDEENLVRKLQTQRFRSQVKCEQLPILPSVGDEGATANCVLEGSCERQEPRGCVAQLLFFATCG